ncbi:hypothetical protein SOVF_027440 [Spinacia oleracea]|uniref:Pentatricopeptide repeat-containing protein At4g01990, mitochondrial n=1 Tax=Spinacia oleracea TaxID=3562 RepID=A0A9R0HUB6_SPIOL|nr:pentatricopeptide repeat-containing protein At4g01990, mitochondrial-like [Spinacia oleracea]KNA23146.1 hypothetical protein SOVF_027440 [Spinacia oleracea]
MLKQNLKLTITTVRLISGKPQLLRSISTATTPVPSTNPPGSRRTISKEDLQKRLWAVLNKGQKVSDVLYQIMRNGEQFLSPDLLSCLQTLRKFGHYNPCLEILDWMDKGKHSYSAADYALRLNLMCKVRSIDDVEKYFDTIPLELKNDSVYGVLLNCYCTKMMKDKALALFKKMDELNYVSNCFAYNSLMSLYTKVGETEKVPLLVEEMKQRSIPLTNPIYYSWIQSYRHVFNLESVEQLVKEIQEHKTVEEDWQIYSNLAAVYIEAGESEKARDALKKTEELFDNPKNADRKAYHYLISMHASTGDSESVYLTWQKLKSKFEICQNVSYLSMLRALSTLDDIEGLKKLLEEWEMSCKIYDDRLPAVAMSAYLKHDMVEEAEHLLKHAKGKAERPIRSPHVVFMNYFLGKHQFDSALEHLEAAMAAKWKPLTEKLDPFFEHFKVEKDVDSAEELCRKLEKVRVLNSKGYLWLLQTYADAGKTAPEMRQRMEKSGVDISTEHEELLQKICLST